MEGIYTVSNLIERLQAFPSDSKITIVKVTHTKKDERLAILGLGPLPSDPTIVMISALELSAE